ncbi:MAG: tripartite tricarboxylate transporter permease [Deltaproteobacteria bacterium]|nr:tripartite tricarboxylate transporter permease [Deltaproteobacteria bacterium]MBW2306597.1 tripartite tricarboxylate transporter permease [Deltaproteobacteria bacterium]
MSVFHHYGEAIVLLADPQVLLTIFLSAVYGLFVGAIPGLTATMATALLIPLTFFMPPLPALAAIVTMEAMAIFAGDIPAALVRIPGTPSSAAYTYESYACTLKGQAEKVLGVGVTHSAIGGAMGAVILLTCAPMLAEVAIRFTSFEYFWLAALGLSTAAIVSRGSPVKGAISLIIGLFCSTIGVDISLGYPRFTFDNVELLNGVSFIPAMIGLFGASEVLRNVLGGQMELSIATSVKAGKIFHGITGVIRRYKVNIIRSGLLGTLIGSLPGAGADIAAWVSYALSKKCSKEPHKFGTGHIEGIVDASTSNNAALGGAWVPALVFGIPGDSITAIVIGVLYMKGMRPGPMIFERTPEILYAVYLTFLLANIVLLPLGWLAIKLSSKVLRVPRNILMPAILVFCIVGSFAINNSVFDVKIMLLMGLLGYFMESNGFPVAPVVLGIVLGPLLEDKFMASMIKVQWDLTQFFSRPISLILGVITLIVWFMPLLTSLFQRLFMVSRKRSSS